MQWFSRNLLAGLAMSLAFASWSVAQDMAPAPLAATSASVAPASADCANGNCGGGSRPVACGPAGCFHGIGGVSAANCNYRQYGPHDLFRQYYAPNNCGGPVAALYPAPHAVPEMVGHTYYTYQPLYPHEFLYPHHRTYHRYYDDGRGLTRTSVKWMR